MRTLYLVDHEWPPTDEDLAAAQAAGAAEVVCGIPPALAAAGIDAFGYHELPDEAPPVPQVVSRMQARVQLAMLGRLAAIDAYMGSGEVDPVTREYWLSAVTFSRDHPLIVSLGPALGWTPDQVDALFRAAALIA